MTYIELVDLISRVVAIFAGGFSIWAGVDRLRDKARKNDDEKEAGEDKKD